MRTSAPPALATAPATNGLPESLHEIVDPRRILSVWDWVLPIVGGLLAVGLIALAWWLWRRHRRKLQEPEPPPPPLPPHDRARRALEAATRLLGDPNAFCTEVSAILRVYLEERFGWNAPDQTTEEFLAQLRNDRTLPPSHQKLLHDFLERCDLVKFARFEPTETELLELQAAALRMVDDTVPPPPPPPGTEIVSQIPGPGPGPGPTEGGVSRA